MVGCRIVVVGVLTWVMHSTGTTIVRTVSKVATRCKSTVAIHGYSLRGCHTINQNANNQIKTRHIPCCLRFQEPKRRIELVIQRETTLQAPVPDPTGISTAGHQRIKHAQRRAPYPFDFSRSMLPERVVRNRRRRCL